MQCIRCGVDIGDQRGLCEACRAQREMPHETSANLGDAAPREAKISSDFRIPGGALAISVFRAAREVYQLYPPLFVGLVVIIVFSIVAYTDIGWRPLRPYHSSRSAGVTFAREPRQTSISMPAWQFQDAQITALAEYELEGLLLFNIAYNQSFEWSRLSPMDLVVTWGPLSDSRVLRQVKFSHGHRVVTLQLERQSQFNPGPFLSHIHAIPASEKIEAVLSSLKEDRGVYLKGKLVRVERGGALPWESSLSRHDSKCEIMWIEEARQLPKTRTP